MKTFGKLLSEVAQPKAGDEKHFKDKHITVKNKHPHASDYVFTGGTKKAPKRLADHEAGEDAAVYEGLDPVDQKELKKKFKDRSDKDIDNDGDVDSSDEYLHARRKAISKAMKKEEAENLEEISRDLARSYIRKASAAEPDRYTKKSGKTRAAGIELAGKKAYSIGGEPKVRATESVELDEKLKASDDMGKWIDDFQKSDNPKFAGKSQKKRREMAIAAKYAAEREAGMREEVKQLDEIGDTSAGKKKLKNLIVNRTQKVVDAGASIERRPEKAAEYDRAQKRHMKTIGRAATRLAKEEVEQLDELSPDLKSRYAKKAATSLKRATTYKAKAQDDAAKASKNIDRGYGGDRSVNIDKQYNRLDRADAKVAKHDKTISKRTSGLKRANEEVEQLDELSPNTLHRYIKKAAGNLGGSTAIATAQALSPLKKASPDVTRNIKNRMKGITSASGRLADKANMAEDAWEEVPMMMSQLEFICYAAEEIMDYLDMGIDPEEWYQNKLANAYQTMMSLYSYARGEMRMSANMYGEETELDESDDARIQRSLSAHKVKQDAKVKAGIPLRRPGESLAAYVTRKAKAQAKMKKEETEIDEELIGGQKKLDHNKNGKIDAQDFHIMRKKKKMSEEAEQVNEVSKGLVGRYLDKARAQRGSGKDREKSIGLAYRKSTPGKRADSGYDSEPKVYAKEDLDESITKMSHGRLKFHLNTNTPHGSYSNDEMKAERDRRLKTGEGEAYRKAKAGLSEVTRSAVKRPVTYIDAEGKSRTRLVPLHKIDRDEHGQEKIKESFLDEAFKAGSMKLYDGSTVTVKNEDAKLLNQLMSSLNDKNRGKMESTLMSSKKGFNEILGFAREALK